MLDAAQRGTMKLSPFDAGVIAFSVEEIQYHSEDATEKLEEWSKENSKKQPWPFRIFIQTTSFACLAMAVYQHQYDWDVFRYINIQVSPHFTSYIYVMCLHHISSILLPF